MLQSNGQRARLNGHSVSTTGNARNASKIHLTVTPAQAEFVRFFSENEIPAFSNSLKLAHDLVLYHTDVVLDDEEKLALYNLKQLWEEIDRLAEVS
jgi:hypothetical protein